MGSHELHVSYPTGDWTIEHHTDCCGGPLSLTVDGKLVVSDFVNSFDGIGNEGLTVKKSHVYHKSGVAVFEGEGMCPSGPETGVWMACRYAGNVARFTTDLSIKRDTGLKDGIQCGSMTLQGKWISLTTVPEFARTELADGQSIHFDELPLAWVFEREDGFKLEIDTGFDVWRWQKAVEMGGATVDVTVHADHVDFKRSLLTVQSDAEEAVMPPPRDYRFCSQMAWSMPSQYVRTDDWPALTPLPLLPKGKGIDVKLLTDRPAVSVDFSAQAALDSMHVTHDGQLDSALCWECNNTKTVAKKVIRQLAAKSSEGYLLIEGGMTPSYCDNGKHVDRSGKSVAHWDLNGITTFAIWARQALGKGWQVAVKQPAPWCELPSLQGLFMANGFESAEQAEEEEE